MGISISNQLLGSTGLSVGLGLSRGNGLSFGGFAGGPALYLPFALTGTLDPRVTFSRPSLATMYDSTGRLVYAPNQLFLQSADFSTASWLKINCSVSGSGNVTLGAGTLAKNIGQAVAANVANNVVSFDVLAGTHSTFQIIDTGDAEAYANFNAATGAVGTKGTRTLSGVTSLGGGAYRLWAVFTAGALSRTVRIYAVDSTSAAYGATTSSTGNFTLLGSASSAVTYETAPRSQDQVITTAAAYYGPRFDYNPATLVARGLLIEEARTNSNLYSEDLSNAWWTKFGASVSGGNTAPDGTTNAYNLVESTANSTHSISRALAVSATNAAVYTLSFYVKTAGRTRARLYIYGFNNYTSILDFSTKSVVSASGGTSPVVTFTDINNSYIRVTITDTTTFSELQFDSISLVSTGTTFSYTGDGVSGMILWGFQRELGSFATSYIPTAASAVARSADSATMTGTNFSSWYNQTQGTFVVSWTYGMATASIPLYTSAFSATTSGTARQLMQNLGNENWYDGTTYFTTGASAGLVPRKTAFAYASGNNAACLDGGTVATSSSALPIAPNEATIGNQIGTNRYVNGWIASLAYYNTRLPNATLQSLTLPVIADYYFLVTAGGDQLTDASGNPLYTQPLYL